MMETCPPHPQPPPQSDSSYPLPPCSVLGFASFTLTCQSVVAAKCVTWNRADLWHESHKGEGWCTASLNSPPLFTLQSYITKSLSSWSRQSQSDSRLFKGWHWTLSTCWMLPRMCFQENIHSKTITKTPKIGALFTERLRLSSNCIFELHLVPLHKLNEFCIAIQSALEDIRSKPELP